MENLLIGKYIAVDAYISLINNLTFTFKKLEKEGQTKCEPQRRKIKLEAEINELEN